MAQFTSSGYRDDSLQTVTQNKDDYGLPLKILSYKDLYGWTMDSIVAQVVFWDWEYVKIQSKAIVSRLDRKIIVPSVGYSGGKH